MSLPHRFNLAYSVKFTKEFFRELLKIIRSQKLMVSRTADTLKGGVREKLLYNYHKRKKKARETPPYIPEIQKNKRI